MNDSYEFRWVMGHVEILKNGVFYGTADNMSEAVRMIEEDDK